MNGKPEHPVIIKQPRPRNVRARSATFGLDEITANNLYQLGLEIGTGKQSIGRTIEMVTKDYLRRRGRLAKNGKIRIYDKQGRLNDQP